ncbi:MAG: hypothetical protein WBO16_10510 [Gammaproteobacteria bacterium]
MARNKMQAENQLNVSLKKTIRTFINIVPIIVGMLMTTSLVITLFPEEISTGLFGYGDIPDAMLGAAIGSIAAGHPLASYLLGGELLSAGTGLIAVTAMLVTWVTVGIVQLPAEALMLGTRFAVYRNIISFCTAVIIALLTVYTLQVLGVA